MRPQFSVLAETRATFASSHGIRNAYWRLRRALTVSVSLAILLLGLHAARPADAREAAHPLAGPVAAGFEIFAGGWGRGPADRVGQQPAALAISGDSLFVADQVPAHWHDRRTIIRVIDLATGLETVVGGTGDASPVEPDGQAVQDVRFLSIARMAADITGSIFAYDSDARRIFKIDPSGSVTTFAGAGDAVGNNIPARDASVGEIAGMLASADGSLLYAEVSSGLVKRIDTQGMLSTFAGGGPCCDVDAGDGGPATGAQLSNLRGLAEDNVGGIFIAGDLSPQAGLGSPVIRYVDPFGEITTVARNVSSPDSGDGGSALAARFGAIGSIAYRPDGTLLVAEPGRSPNRVRAIDQAGMISTLAVFSDPAWTAIPNDLVVDASGFAYAAAQYESRIYRIDSSGSISIFAGTGIGNHGGDGGPAVDAQFASPRALLDDGLGNLFVSEDRRVRKIDASGTVTTFAGNGGNWVDSGDGGPATNASLGGANGLARDSSGNTYIATNSSVRRVDDTGEITTVAGSGQFLAFTDGAKATSVGIAPTDVYFDDTTGNLWIAESINFISCYGTLMYSSLLRVDAAGQIWRVADSIAHPELHGLNTIARDPAGGVVAGTGTRVGVSGCPLPRGTPYPPPISIGNYIVKYGASQLGALSGNGVPGFAGESEPAGLGQWDSPQQLGYDGVGNLFVADYGNARIRTVDSNGVLGTFAGNGARGNVINGVSPTDTPLCPSGLAMRGLDSVFVSEDCGNKILRFDRSPDPGLRQIYFAEGTVRPGFSEYLTLHNPEEISANVLVEFQAADDAGQRVIVPPHTLYVPPKARSTLSVTDHVRSAGILGPTNLAMRIRSNRRISAERPLYFSTDQRVGNQVTGGTTSTGVAAPSVAFLFAEGTYRPGFVTYLTVQNPGNRDADMRIELLRPSASPYGGDSDSFVPSGASCIFAPRTVSSGVTAHVGIAAQSRSTINLATELGRCGAPIPLDFAVSLTSSEPIVAERPIYFATDPGLGSPITGGTLVAGRTAYGNDFTFAEGTVRPGFVEYLVIAAPSGSAAAVKISLGVVDDAGQSLPTPERTFTVWGRATFNVRDLLESSGISVSANVTARVTSSNSILVERVLYFSHSWQSTGHVDGGTSAIGASGPAEMVSLAEGTVRPGFQQYLTLSGSGEYGSWVLVNFYVFDDDGLEIPVPYIYLHVPTSSRRTIDVNSHLLQHGVNRPVNVSTTLRSSAVIVERPTYFNANVGGGVSMDGGAVASGYAI